MNIFGVLRRIALYGVPRSIERVVSPQSFGSSLGPLSGDSSEPCPFRCDQLYLDGRTPGCIAPRTARWQRESVGQPHLGTDEPRTAVI
jgi:hypothetical protein